MGKSTALVVAHPAHELRLLSWFRTVRPRFSVLTTGSRNGQDLSRLDRSQEIAAHAGAAIGPLFGAALDKDLYRLVMNGDALPFHEWTSQLAESFVADRVSQVVCDAWQFYNVAHDLTHLIARVAAAEAEIRLGAPIEVLEFLSVPKSLAPRLDCAPAVLTRSLSEEEVQPKRATLKDYPGIEAELDEILRLEGNDGLAREALFRPAPIERLARRPDAKPPYEVFGEQRVRAGVYPSALGWTHVRGVADSLFKRHQLATGRTHREEPAAPAIDTAELSRSHSFEAWALYGSSSMSQYR